MRITNKFGLPGAIVQAIKNDNYNRGESDITVTQLVNPAKIRVLRKKYDKDIVVDASDMIFALLGKAIHYILESSEPNALVEKRLYTTIDGWKLGGQYDRMSIRKKTLQDYKLCGVWEAIFGLKPERIAQVNLLGYLARQNGYTDIENLEIIAIFRDWSRSKAEHDKDYPQHQVSRITVPVWSDLQCLKYAKQRIKAHADAEKVLPDCSKEERWATDDKYAVIKKGRKKAYRVLDSKEEAEQMIKDKGKDYKDYSIEFREGISKRCKRYCNVAPFCDQYKKEEK